MIGETIERAALILFAKRGADNVTAEDIADAAGISRRTFFRHFESKDDILAAAPLRALRATAEHVGARPAHESIAQALLGVARDHAPSPAERDMHLVWVDALNAAPEAWTRARARLRSMSDDAFTQMAAHRLRLAGQSDAYADVIGVALAAVVRRVYFIWAGEGGALVDQLEQGLQSLALIDASENDDDETDGAGVRRRRRVGRGVDVGPVAGTSRRRPRPRPS